MAALSLSIISASSSDQTTPEKFLEMFNTSLSRLKTYGYSDPSMAKSLLGELEISGDPCISWKTCSIRCPANFRIKEKVADTSRLINVPAEFLT